MTTSELEREAVAHANLPVHRRHSEASNRARAEEFAKKSAHAWSLRLKGYNLTHIGEEMGVSFPTAQKYVEWAMENIPSVIESAEDFKRVALDRIEAWVAALEPQRAEGDVMAYRVSQSLLDQQAKILGVYTQRLDVSAHLTYSVEGVDMADDL